jgi:propanol-preferring alcohol dehydrogenase
MAEDARVIGLYGFGAAAHTVAQLALWEGRRVFAFTRRGDARSQAFAGELGCTWAGDAEHSSAEPLDAAINFVPAGELVSIALRARP